MIKAAHPYENKETGECCDPLCPCHQFARQDAPLVQVPLEHAPLRSLTESHDDELYDAYRRGYADGWGDAQMERLRAENEDLRQLAKEGR